MWADGKPPECNGQKEFIFPEAGIISIVEIYFYHTSVSLRKDWKEW